MIFQALLSLLFLIPIRTEAQVIAPVTLPIATVERLPIKLSPALIPICTCESGQGTGKPQQYNIHTGEVLHGAVNPADLGACQINTKFWQSLANKLGYDLTTRDGNYSMANYIYETEGAAPWRSSEACWAS